MAAAVDSQRFARQLLLAEIGEAGQARLCAAHASVPAGADARAAEVARDYLERAGLCVSVAGEAADSGANGAVQVVLALPDSAAVRMLAGRAELDEAAAALAGALAAVDAIKTVLGMPASAALPRALNLARENDP